MRFEARYQADRQSIEWVFSHGSETQPELRSQTTHLFDFTAEERSVKGLRVTWDAENMGSVSWAQGGRSADTVTVERASDTYLTDAGYPLMHIVDTSHTDASLRPTLQGYAAANLNRARGPIQQWTFQTHKQAAPYVGSFLEGDRCIVKIRNNPYIPDGDHVRDIAGISGDQGDWVTVTTTAAVL